MREMACIYGAGQQPVFVVELVVGTYFTWYTHNTQYQVPVQVGTVLLSNEV